MPEIKHNFLQGKMNKDLDERLVPNGQYRDAQNIDVSVSEGSDVGTVQNILGNLRIDRDANGNFIVPQNSICVGSISDENRNQLYWFVKAVNREAIIRYDEASNTSMLIAVDLSMSEEPNVPYEAFLKFTGKPITGINIIDDFLFWSDGDSEPKKINIGLENDQYPATINDHSTIIVDGESVFMREEHVTVIKKKPSIAPCYDITTSSGLNLSPIFERIFPRFCFRYKYVDGEYSALGPFTDVIFNPKYIGNINQFNAYSIDEPYNKVMLNFISSIDLYDFVPADIPDDVVQVDILYKQENSPIVYSIANIKRDSDAWNEEGFTQYEGYNSTHKGKYTVNSENIHAALSSEQTIRAYDNVPKKALAQEIIGNRLVYGNYTQGYDIPIQPSLKANIHLRYNQDFQSGGLKSIKSLRNYRLGVVFGDKYGRETPVFTSDNAELNIGWSDLTLGNYASVSTMISAAITSDIPDWADYYKFYIKQTSGEYYNLIMDKAYPGLEHTSFENPGAHAWISFASSDRNKITEDDFIIIKKVITPEPEQVHYNNRYKILDISNEAPDAVRYMFSNLGTLENDIDDTLAQDILASDGFRPNDDTNTLRIDKDEWVTENLNGSPLVVTNTNGEIINPDAVKDIYVSWNASGEYSERYKAISVSVDAENYVVKLEKKITEVDQAIADGSGNNELNLGLTFKVERRDERPPEDFSGKFFVKIKKDLSLTSVPVGEAEDQLSILSQQNSLWLWGQHNDPDDYNESTGIINSYNQSLADPSQFPSDGSSVTGLESGDLPNSQEDWENILSAMGDNRFFIDNMNFIASNPNVNNWAKEAGEGWKGVNTRYEQFHWGYWERKVWRSGYYLGGGNYSDDVVLKSLIDIVNDFSETFGPFEQDGSIPEYDGSDDGYKWIFGEPIEPDEAPPFIEHPTLNLVDEDGDPYLVRTIEHIPTLSHFGTYASHGLYPRPQVNYTPERLINGIEGIITSQTEHILADGTSGYRRWHDSTLYQDWGGLDNTYGTEPGKYFIHLSFLAPGVDLRSEDWLDGTGLPNVHITGKDSIATKLQGIYGGGIFTNSPDVLEQGSIGDLPLTPWHPAYEVIVSDSNLAQHPSTYIVEFEGHYDTVTGEGLQGSPGIGQGQGYDTTYLDAHLNQWNAAYEGNNLSGSTNPAIQEFIDHLENQTDFRFANDPNGTVYNILSISKKKLYNHTSWRARWIWNGESYEKANNSVEEAAQNWAREVAAANGNTNQDVIEAAEALKKKICSFGSASNRRVCYIIEVDKNPNDYWNPTNTTDGIDFDTPTLIQFITTEPQALSSELLTYPAIWETEPQQLADLNIYYEASANLPLRLDSFNSISIFAQNGCDVQVSNLSNVDPLSLPEQLVLESFDQQELGVFYLNPGLPHTIDNEVVNYNNAIFRFSKYDNSYVHARIADIDVDTQTINDNFRTKFVVDSIIGEDLPVGLSWYNCFSFGDGVESNRIRDKFNDMQLFSGAKASATLEEPYSEEHRKSGLIYSGIYNSNSGVNNLNQFISGLKITKDLNPTYGSIQKLFARNTDLVALCEDRVLKILANKDALFNADGNPQLVATENVLGQAIPFVGDYGISQNPESFASESYRAYFADQQRTSILRLSKDGITPISDAGMRDWFRDNINSFNDLLGSYDEYSQQYNITIRPKLYENLISNATVQFGEASNEFFIEQSVIANGTFGVGGVQFPGITSLADLPQILINPNLESTVTIRNHHEILVGDIFEGVEAVDAQDPIETVFAVNAFESQSSDVIFADDYTNPLSFVSQIGGSLSSAIPQASSKAFGGEDVDSIFNLPSQVGPTPPNVQGGYTVVNNGVAFYDLQPGYFYGIRTPYWSPYADPSFPGPGVHWNHSVPENVLNSEAYGSLSPSVKNNTIFNGEEIRIEFDAAIGIPGKGVLNEAGLSSAQVSGPFTWRVSLRDGETLISNLDNPVETWSPPYTYTLDPEEMTPYNSRGYLPIDMPSLQENNPGGTIFNVYPEGTGSFTFQIIPATYSGLVPTDDQLFKFVAYVKFRDTVNPDQEGKIIDNLVVSPNVTFSSSLGDIPMKMFIKNINISKVFRLKTPAQDGVEAVDGQPPIPNEVIPAWAEVIHGPFEGWTTNIPAEIVDQVTVGGISVDIYNDPSVNLNYGIEYLYGPQNLAEEVLDDNGNFLYFVGESNGQTNYLDYPGNPVENQNYSEFNLTQEEINDGLDGYFAAGVRATAIATGDNSDNIPQIIQALDQPLEQGHVYYLEVRCNFANNPPILMYGAPSFGEAGPSTLSGWTGNFIPSDLSINYGSSLHLELLEGEAETSGIVTYYGKFTYVDNDVTGDFDPNNLKIGFYDDALVRVHSIKLWDITVEEDAVYAPESWGQFGNQASWTQQDLLDFPSIYYAYEQVNWLNAFFPTTPAIAIQATLAQQLDPVIPTSDGWQLKFEIKENPDYGAPGFILGSLRVGLKNDNADLFAAGNFSEIGEYRVSNIFNSLGTAITSEYKAPGSDQYVPHNIIDVSNEQFWFNDNATNRIRINPGPNGFAGAIDNISLTNATNYFTIGGPTDWLIQNLPTDNIGGDLLATENYIYWDDQNGTINFDQAPGALGGWYQLPYLYGLSTLDNTQSEYIGQNIGYLEEDMVLTLSFLQSFSEGAIVVSYFNEDGQGFVEVFEVGMVPVASYVETTVTIGDNNVPVDQLQDTGVPVNTLIIHAKKPNPNSPDQYVTTGYIDNLELRQSLSIPSYTVSFSESVGGWVSFKSFIPESGLSLSSKYYTMFEGGLWQHHVNETRGTFYNTRYNAAVSVILNDNPSVVKNFQTLTYEGSQSRVYSYDTETVDFNGEELTLTNFDIDLNNRITIAGWHVVNNANENIVGIQTDLESGTLREFIEKEGKWFNNIRGTGNVYSFDASKLNFQGLGTVESTES